MVAKSFLWNQVRRMASAITGVVSGEYDLDFLAKSIENPNIPDMGMGSSKGLILWEINHSALDGIGIGSVPDTRNILKATIFTKGS